MNWGVWGQWCLHSLIGQLIWSVPKQGDSRNVSRPVARILMEANIGHLPTKFGYNQMQGWKVINRYRILEVNFHILPHLTFDLLMWPLTPEYHGGQYRHLLTKFGYKQMQGWKVINCYRVLQVNFHIWPLTYLCDLWPQNIMEANIGHLPNQVWLQTDAGLESYQPFYSRAGKPSHLTSFDLWPTYVTFNPRISWRPT